MSLIALADQPYHSVSRAAGMKIESTVSALRVQKVVGRWVGCMQAHRGRGGPLRLPANFYTAAYRS